MGRGRKRSRPLPEDIIEAYLDLAEEIGVYQVTLQKVARRAAISYSTVHYHFGPPNPDIIDVATEHIAQRAREYVRAKVESALLEPDVNCIEAYVRANFKWAEEHRSHGSFLLHSLYLGTVKGNVHKKVGDYLAHGQARIQQLLKLEMARHRYPAHPDLPFLALTIQNAIVGGLVAGSSARLPKGLRQQAEITLKVVNSILRNHSMLPPSPNTFIR